MKAKHFINLHKGTTFFVVFGLMLAYQNFTLGFWVYLAPLAMHWLPFVILGGFAAGICTQHA